MRALWGCVALAIAAPAMAQSPYGAPPYSTPGTSNLPAQAASLTTAQAPSAVLAAPTGSAGVPGFRVLTPADISGLSGFLTSSLTTPPPIGGTTPAAGAFTTLSASGAFNGSTGAFTGTFGAGPLAVTDPSSTASIVINGASNSNGATLRLTGNGGSTPGKTLRATVGLFDIMNNASNAEILRVDDAGNATVYGNMTLYGSGKVYLDSSGTLWVQEVSGSFVFGTGSTRLMSLSATGNLITKGTMTGSGTP